MAEAHLDKLDDLDTEVQQAVEERARRCSSPPGPVPITSPFVPAAPGGTAVAETRVYAIALRAVFVLLAVPSLILLRAPAVHHSGQTRRAPRQEGVITAACGGPAPGRRVPVR